MCILSKTLWYKAGHYLWSVPTKIFLTPLKYDDNLAWPVFLVNHNALKQNIICEVSPNIMFVTSPQYDDNIVWYACICIKCDYELHFNIRATYFLQ